MNTNTDILNYTNINITMVVVLSLKTIREGRLWFFKRILERRNCKTFVRGYSYSNHLRKIKKYLGPKRTYNTIYVQNCKRDAIHGDRRN